MAVLLFFNFFYHILFSLLCSKKKTLKSFVWFSIIVFDISRVKGIHKIVLHTKFDSFYRYKVGVGWPFKC